jgi:hypothetical protein
MRERTIVLAFALVAGACRPSPVQPDEMSAAGHRREASREMAIARDQTSSHDPEQSVIVGTDRDYLYPVFVYNPKEGNLRAAEAHMDHAREHLAAAETLERFEEQECADFPPESRAACPLFTGVVAVEDIPGGVLLRFEPGAQVAARAAHMRCHLAYARARGYRQNEACPLYLRGVIITTPAAGGEIGITSGDAQVIEVIRRMVREEVLPSTGPVT